ncbi:hypothetical protein [Chamaesiphon sp. VAR_69_metabat_338]|uniref:hypothetical protein n=1 Tax=Chamaesiphon sp. VAR_69_metabat_338 TaxID=2964704 RepID=UPI00286DB1E9|nr:hypothetical protein [Chamaesiphon sp. VAR_69_metabat_338]
MHIESIEIEMDITKAGSTLDLAIETALQQWGEPLRWAITEIDRDTNTAKIEAIVIKD